MELGATRVSLPEVDAALDRLRRGAVEYCVLALLRGGSAYSYEVVTALGSVHGLVTSEGTLYPLLSRLRRDGLVSTQWQESPSGPPRRYYALTPAGERTVDAFATAWGIFQTAVDQVLSGTVPANRPQPASDLTRRHRDDRHPFLEPGLLGRVRPSGRQPARRAARRTAGRGC